MKQFTLAVSIILFACGSASAADLSMKAAVPMSIPSWAGFYIGGHGGYGWKDDPFSVTLNATDPASVVNGFKSRGWIGGGHVGYNWQYGAMVGGLELDVSATGIRGNSATGSTSTGPGSTLSQSYGHDVKFLASARGRLGWAPNSDWLLYGTGGLAWEHADQIVTFGLTGPGTSTSATSSTPYGFLGWVLGGGVEARLTGTNWIARLEYLHYDFGHTRFSSTTTSVIAGVPTSSANRAGNQTIDVVRAGLSYKFGL